MLQPIQDNDYTAEGEHHCGRCAGTGRFITGSLNGKPTGPGGICFRCSGKGAHDLGDRKRNEYFDTHRSIAI